VHEGFWFRTPSGATGYKVMREARIRHAGLGLGSIGSMTARHHDPTNHPSTKGYIPEIQSDKKPPWQDPPHI